MNRKSEQASMREYMVQPQKGKQQVKAVAWSLQVASTRHAVHRQVMTLAKERADAVG